MHALWDCTCPTPACATLLPPPSLPAGCVLASLLPTPEARPLGVEEDLEALEAALGSPRLVQPAAAGEFADGTGADGNGGSPPNSATAKRWVGGRCSAGWF